MSMFAYIWIVYANICFKHLIASDYFFIFNLTHKKTLNCSPTLSFVEKHCRILDYRIP